MRTAILVAWPLILASLLFSLFPSRLSAQGEGGGRDEARASALIRRGLALRQRGDDREALARFEEAYQLSPSPLAQAQRALAEAALGQWLEANAHLSEAMSHGSDRWIRENDTLLRLGETLCVCSRPVSRTTTPPKQASSLLTDGNKGCCLHADNVQAAFMS